MMLKRLYYSLVFLMLCNAGFGQGRYEFCDSINHKEHEVNLYFETGRYDLTENHIHILDSLKSLFIQEKKSGLYVFQVLGYTDTVGEDSANLKLSQKRVSNVMQYYTQNLIIRRLCVGFFNPYFFFRLSDSISDTTGIRMGYLGENVINNDSTGKNRRVNIQVVLYQSFGPDCGTKSLCCGAPAIDTTIKTAEMEVTVPKSSLYWSCVTCPSQCDSIAKFNFATKTQHYKGFIINQPGEKYNVCRIIQMGFHPYPFHFTVNNIHRQSYALITVKLLLSPCELENNLRLYGYHKNDNGLDTLHPLIATRGNLLQQDIITENKQYYLIAKVPLSETDSLILAYPITEAKPEKTKTLIFKGKQQVKPYVIDGCGLKEISTTPSSGFFFRKSAASINSKEKTVYIKSGEDGKYWPVKVSKFRKKKGGYVLGRRKLRRIMKQKPVSICIE